MVEEPLRLNGGRVRGAGGAGRQGQEPRLCHICLRNVVKSGSEEFIISQKSVRMSKAGGMREAVYIVSSL